MLSVQQVHPLSDLSCFRCLAWSTDPSVLPLMKELWVVEPLVAIIKNPPLKRVLSYPIELRYSVALSPDGSSPPSSSDERDDAGGDSARR